MARKFPLVLLLFAIVSTLAAAQTKDPVRIAVVGLTHDHVHGIFNYKGDDIKIVAIVEANKLLAQRYAKQYGFSMDMVYNDIDAMIEAAHPEAVSAFTSIFDHLQVVKKCAPKGIDVMVEKPLAVNMVHAKQMEAIARQNHIHLVTNYETTWYSSNQKVYAMLKDDALGAPRKIVVHDGHQGPSEIGVSQEFLQWLTDPVQNGGGAIIDFGCYGADLMTWIMGGQKPLTVTAVTQQIKPGIYPNVDDEATIVITYPDAQGIIQASWNWPFNRKDMEVYGKTGYAFAVNNTDVRYRLAGEDKETTKVEQPRPAPYNSPFSFFAAVVRDQIKVKPGDLSSLETNMIVMEILDAAVKSSKTGKTIKLNP